MLARHNQWGDLKCTCMHVQEEEAKYTQFTAKTVIIKPVPVLKKVSKVLQDHKISQQNHGTHDLLHGTKSLVQDFYSNTNVERRHKFHLEVVPVMKQHKYHNK